MTIMASSAAMRTPVPSPKANGNMATIVVSAVIKMGLSLVRLSLNQGITGAHPSLTQLLHQSDKHNSVGQDDAYKH